MASPLFRINGGDPGVKASVSASGSVVATLDSTDGVGSTEWFIDTTDDLSEPGDYTLVQSGSVGQTVSTTALTAGTGAKLRARINGGINRATELPDPTGTNATAKFFVPTALGREVGVAGEEFESDATNGSTGIINQAVRESGSVSSIVGSAPITVTGTTTLTVAITAASGSASGSMSSSDFTKLGNATSAATAARLAIRGASAELSVGYLEAGATPASAGTLRLGSGASIYSKVGGANLKMLSDDGAGVLQLGDMTQATGIAIIAQSAAPVDIYATGASGEVNLWSNEVKVLQGVGGLLKAPRYTSLNGTSASVGLFAAANADGAILTVRNAGDTGDISIASIATDQLRIGNNSSSIAFLTNAAGSFSFSVNSIPALSIKSTGIEFPANYASATITTAASTSATTLLIKGADGANFMSGTGRDVRLQVGDPFDGTFSPGNFSIGLGTGTGGLSGTVKLDAGAQNLLTGQYTSGTGVFLATWDVSLTIDVAGATIINAAEDQTITLSYNGTPRFGIDSIGVGFLAKAATPAAVQSITGAATQLQVDSIVTALVAFGFATDDR